MKKRVAALLVFGLVVLFMVNSLFVKAQSENGNCWFERTSMPTARFSFGVAVVNGKIHSLGGSYMQIHENKAYYAEITNANEVYDPATNAWTAKAPMPTSRTNFALAVYENKIYAFGGQIAGSEIATTELTNATEVYDPVIDTWTVKSSVPIATSDFSANVVDGKIYLISAQTQVYDPATDSWTTKAPIPAAVVDYASAVVNNKIYVIGGRTSDGVIALNQIYDPKTDLWSTGKPIPIAVQAAGAGATTGVMAPKAIYVIGGLISGDPFHAQNCTQVYFPENDSWRTGAAMPVARASLGVAVVNDALYAIGGGYEIFNPNSNANSLYLPIGYEGPAPTYQPLSPSTSPSPISTPVVTLNPTPLLTQTPTPTPSPIASAIPTSSPLLTSSPSPTPTSTTSSSASGQQSGVFPMEYVYFSAGVVTVVVIAVGVFFLKKKQLLK